jgi:hypothetical protein
MQLYYDWLRRLMSPVGGFPLGGPGELWRAVPRNPANDWVGEKAKELGRTYDDLDVAYYTSRSLLWDVVHAAGAIEYTVGRIEAASDAVQADAIEHALTAELEHTPHGLRTLDVDDAYIEYANLLNWLRTLLDRMRSQDPYSKAKLGLVPALSDAASLRRTVEKILDRLSRDTLVEDEVNLTNFGLHLHALPGQGTPSARLTVDGRTRLLIPDKPKGRVYLFDQFTYDDERELVPFARALLDRVSQFIDELLSAFETGVRDAIARRANG